MGQCNQCNKSALFRVGDTGIELCLDCREKFNRVIAAQTQAQAQYLNFLTAQIEHSVGMPGLLPRMAIPQTPIAENMTFNHIQVDRSTIGVINTGHIHKVDNAITVLQSQSQTLAAEALTRLAQAVAASNDVPVTEKERLSEILGAVSDEAIAPVSQRRKAVARALLTDFASAVTVFEGLAAVWAQWGPALLAMFH